MAAAKIREGCHHVYLIDYRLGARSGFDLLGILRESGSRAAAIMLTGSTGQTLDTDALEAGAEDYLVKGGVSPDGLSRSLRYALARKHYENALRDSEERLRLALDAAEMAVCEWDIVEDTISGNARWAWMWNFDNVPARTSVEYLRRIHPQDRRRVREKFSELFREGSVCEQEFRIGSGASGRWVYGKGQVWRNLRGEPVRIAGGAIDITARKNAEEALKLAARQKDEFLAMLAHELRNPLGAISNSAAVSQRQDSLEGYRSSRELIQRQVGHLVRLIDELLDLSRLSRGIVQVRRESLLLSDCVRHAITATSALMESKNHQLEYYPESEPLCISGDATRLEQALTNLLANAAKYTEPGGRITVREGAHVQEAEVEISDTGLGIAEKMQEQIFEPFVQVEQSLDRCTGGLGIGLTLVKQIAEMHGGSVRMHSDGLGMGSTFILRLPLTEPAELPAVSAAQMTTSVPVSSDRSLRVLVVDDNRDNGESLSLLLELEGHITRLETDGPAAVRAADIFRPDVVLLDVGLPQMNGYEVVAELRKNVCTRESLIAAISGYGQREDVQKALAAGFDCHLTKPVDWKILSGIIEDFCRAPMRRAGY
jgi:two-component system CheB/CheR fusion protein